MARRVARASARRGATSALEPRIGNEVGAIAVVAFALLSAVALAADQGALLHWWRTSLFAVLGWGATLVPLVLAAAALELWFGFMRRDAVLPIVGGTIAVFALLGLARHYLRDDLAGGLVGGAVASAVTGAFGDVGAPIALFALLLAGVVMAANRTLADLIAPAWRRRDVVTALRPGTTLPGGTAPKFAEILEEEERGGRGAEPPDVRINLPEPRPPRPAQPRLRPQELASGAPPVAAPPAVPPLPRSLARLPRAACASRRRSRARASSASRSRTSPSASCRFATSPRAWTSTARAPSSRSPSGATSRGRRSSPTSRSSRTCSSRARPARARASAS